MQIPKDKITVLIAVIAGVFFITTVASCISAAKMKDSHKKEMFTRLDLEEKQDKLNREKASLEEKLVSATAQLEALQNKHTENEKSLTQEKLVNESLKEELKKVTKRSSALEEELKALKESSKTVKDRK